MSHNRSPGYEPARASRRPQPLAARARREGRAVYNAPVSWRRTPSCLVIIILIVVIIIIVVIIHVSCPARSSSYTRMATPPDALGLVLLDAPPRQCPRPSSILRLPAPEPPRALAEMARSLCRSLLARLGEEPSYSLARSMASALFFLGFFLDDLFLGLLGLLEGAMSPWMSLPSPLSG